jgi:hypothetical protein
MVMSKGSREYGEAEKSQAGSSRSKGWLEGAKSPIAEEED